MRSIIWFRRDLRLEDNRALAAAAKESGQLLALYFVTKRQWQIHNDAPAKIAFSLESLQELKAGLNKLNIPLLILECQSYLEIPELLRLVAVENGCHRLYFNAEYEVNEKRRDEAVSALLKAEGIETFVSHDRMLIEPGKVLTGQGKPYTVYTPFRNNWAKQILKQDIRVLPVPEPVQRFDPKISHEKLSKNLFEIGRMTSRKALQEDLWPVGEGEAHARLKSFIESSLQEYSAQRDFPALHGTSRISPYLAAGTLSPRQCLAAILQSQERPQTLPDFSSSAGTWLNELVWRDFYSHVLEAFPRVCKSLPFQLITEKVKWRYDEDNLQAWKDGLTGYPIVDAAMRQLKQTGWMHNRLRMITAMFFSKDLLLDWREGEKWFMQNLIDGDLAANNGGWQWSASTGTDAAPYFRIFNPFSQSKKFDSAGTFIRTYCPELTPVSAKALHDPELLKAEIRFLRIDYPEPIVDHAKARNRAIAAFK